MHLKFDGFPGTKKIIIPKNNKKWIKFFLPLIGFFCLVWFLIRVVPKPSRIAYPCQRIAAPLAFSFTVWAAGLISSGILYFKTKISLRYLRLIAAAGLCAAVIISAIYMPINIAGNNRSSYSSNNILSGYTTYEKPNSPIGDAKGINPGRVTWVRDINATKYDSEGNGFWWDDSNTDQIVVNEMMSRSIRWLAGKQTDKEAWDAIFKYFNRNNNGSSYGYKKGEKIVIKVNLNQDRGTEWKSQHMPSPQVVYALVDQLINVVGANGEDIVIADASRTIGDPLYNKIHSDSDPKFQAVKFVGQNRIPPVKDMSHPINFSGENIPDAGVPSVYIEAKYIINMALFRAHTIFGVTLCGKNHFGSVYFKGLGFNPVPLHVSQWSAYGSYHCIVDLIGHEQLGGKTLLYIIDGLYHSSNQEDKTIDKFTSFENGWASSIFTSQDPVAIDSVALDFLADEPTISINGSSGCPDNYLIEAALADSPPSGTLYNPNNTGRLSSLGVHEHWNNPEDKKYSRNLGTGNGIELISEAPFNNLAGMESDGVMESGIPSDSSNLNVEKSPAAEDTESEGSYIKKANGEKDSDDEKTKDEEKIEEEKDSQKEEARSLELPEGEKEGKSNILKNAGKTIRKIVEYIYQFFINLWVWINSL